MRCHIALLLGIPLAFGLTTRATGSEFTSLFDGKTLDGWTLRDQKDQQENWRIENGKIIADNPNKQGSVLWTEKAYRDYELELEYRTPSDYYDSGVMLRGNGHQVQIGISGSLKVDMTGCIYAPKDGRGGYPARTEKIADFHKVGKWNHLRVILTGKRIQTFLNGEPFVDYEGVAINEEGPIGLQLHGGHHMKMLFKNIRLRPPAIELFNGEDLSGWEHFLVDDEAKPGDVWSVEDGILVCKGEPMGYIAAPGKYEDFRLVVEWRWAPGTEPGNSGVLMRIAGKPRMLPSCVEVQLQSGNAGDIFGFQGFKIDGEASRRFDLPDVDGGLRRGLRKKARSEKTPGEWNRCEITVQGDGVSVIINGKKVNEATGCDARGGKIALQSEGGIIHFRRVELTPLE